MTHIGLHRLTDLEPEFRGKITALLEALALQDVFVCVVSCRRTIQQQNQLYDQGRTLPGKIVTNARGGQSAHNFGLACDLAPLNADGNIDWNDHHGFRIIANTAEDMGLVSGAFFKSITDWPHVEACNWRATQAAWKRGEIEVA